MNFAAGGKYQKDRDCTELLFMILLSNGRCYFQQRASARRFRGAPVPLQVASGGNSALQIIAS